MSNKKKDKGNAGFINKMFGKSNIDAQSSTEDDQAEKIEPAKKKVGNTFSQMLEQRKVDVAKRNKQITANAKAARKEREDFENKLSDAK